MIGAGEGDCPFEFNFDEKTFKVGDVVSYRIPDKFDEMPFVGTLVAVEEAHVIINGNDPMYPDRTMRGTREDRPVVTSKEALG